MQDLVEQQLRDARAKVALVEVHQRLAGVDHLARLRVTHRRAVGIVEHALNEVARRALPHQPQLIGNADGAETVALVETAGSSIHLHLCAHLVVRQFRKGVGAPVKPGALLDQPVEMLLGLFIAHQIHLGKQVGLVQVFDGQAAGADLRGVEHGIEHPHAAGVELSHDTAFAQDGIADALPQLFRSGIQLHAVHFRDVLLAVRGLAGLRPLLQFLHEVVVLLEVVGPETRILHIQTRQGACVVEQRNEARPGAVEIAQQENGPLVRLQRTGHMVGIGPAAEHHHHRRLRVNLGKHLGAVALLGDEAMLALGVIAVCNLGRHANLGEGLLHLLQRPLLRGPAHLAGALAVVAIGDEINDTILAHVPCSLLPDMHRLSMAFTRQGVP